VAAKPTEGVVLADDDALAFADGIFGHHRHAAAQQLAGRRVAQPAQGVDAQPLGLRPVGVRHRIQLGPEGKDHGVGRAAVDGPAGGEGVDEGLQGFRLDGASPERDDLADFDIVERCGHG
jgi:hypothetical protein